MSTLESSFANVSSISFSEGGGYGGRVERELKNVKRRDGYGARRRRSDRMREGREAGRVVELEADISFAVIS
jgi:hypothetical protein